jgi:hypothetical protein
VVPETGGSGTDELVSPETVGRFRHKLLPESCFKRDTIVSKDLISGELERVESTILVLFRVMLRSFHYCVVTDKSSRR